MRIDLETNKGVRPRLDPRLLGHDEAQIAENCRLWSGKLAAWKKPLNVFPAGTNYLLWSERFDNAVWAKMAVTAQANVGTGPDGSGFAEKLVEDATDAIHSCLQTISKAAQAERWTGAASFKAAERQFAGLEMAQDDGTNACRAVIDLNTGVVTSTSQTNGTGATIIDTHVEQQANGYWRLHLTILTTTANTLRLRLAIKLDGGAGFAYQGDGASGIYVFGASLRKSDKPGPYRVTEGSARPNVPQSFYRFKEQHWFLFDQRTDVARAPLGDTAEITFFTRDSGEPRFTYSPVAEDPASRTEMPHTHHTLGLPVPANPPVATLAPATGNITGAVGIISSVGSQATASFNINGVATDGSRVKASCKFSTTLSYVNVATGRIIFSIARAGIVIGAAELPIVFQGQPPFAAITIAHTLEVEDQPPAGSHNYTFGVTIQADGGGTITGTHNHTGAHVRYTKTKITSANHGRAQDSLVRISGVQGMEALNGEDRLILSVVDANNFYVDVDCLGQTYTSGGSWTQDFTDEDRQDTAYVVTFLSTVGDVTMEGPPSPQSNIIARGSTEPVNLTGLPTAAPSDGGSYVLTGKRLYRTNVRSDIGANWQFVAELALAADSYTDSKSPFELGEVMPSADWIKPPSDMRGLINVSNEVMAGFSPETNEVCFSALGAPHAWPLKYRFKIPAPIVALAALGNATAVLTSGRPSVIHGTVPGEMRQENLEVARPCVSAESAVDMGYAVVYASTNGLVYLSSGRADVITRDLFTEEEWAQLNPSSIKAAAYDDRYVGFYELPNGTRGGFVFDPQDPIATWTTLNFGADACWTDPRTGDLYVLIDEYIARWNAGDEHYTAKWRSKRYDLGGGVSVGFARVQASQYPVTFRLYGSANPDTPDVLTQVYEQNVQNGRPFPLPPVRINTCEIEHEIASGAVVKRSTIATSVDEIF